MCYLGQGLEGLGYLIEWMPGGRPDLTEPVPPVEAPVLSAGRIRLIGRLGAFSFQLMTRFHASWRLDERLKHEE